MTDASCDPHDEWVVDLPAIYVDGGTTPFAYGPFIIPDGDCVIDGSKPDELAATLDRLGRKTT